MLKNISSRIFPPKLLLIPAAVILAILLYHFKGVFVAATVNGEPISRYAVVSELEKEGGQSVLDNLVTNDLILQEAKKEKVTVTQSEINDQITQITDNLKSQGEDLNTALAAQGMTQKDLQDQVKLQLLVQKMAGKSVTVSDQEISDYFNQNKSTYPKGATLASEQADIKNTLQQQKLQQAESTFIDGLKSKAKINYFVGY
ncbi:MAG TPA: SurA N-terminal domain-containing protein [Patescibacteria group bacterium]|nr:SurA N-terminal domain-containing protein [Patescibacteria group bacterium]